MDDNGHEAIAERAVETFSSQPRFKEMVSSTSFFMSDVKWLGLAEDEEPEYSPNSRERDTWLQNTWRKEPHLAGVVNGVVLVDANRGWTLTGGRNQVIRFTNIMHAAEQGQGWRAFARKQSLSYWATDMGSITELGRDGRDGPLRGMYHVDPGRCQLTGDPDAPLKYYPPRGKLQEWRATDFFRVASMPSDQETYHGLGFCAVSRCLELAKIMVAVYRHDQEQLLAKAPRGILLLNNIDEEQWKQVMQAREARMSAKEQHYYGAIEVIASMGVDEPDAKLIALSQLPANFDMAVFTDQLMYGYALCFGFDPTEFWPVNAGVMGRGKETDIQHRKAVTKGGRDWSLSFQERLQNDPSVLPASLLFEFEERDEEGELLAATVNQAKVEVVSRAYETGLQFGSPMITREEARQLLVEYGVIPAEWTEAEEEATETDTGEERARLREQPRVQQAFARFPNEPIVRYHFRTNRLETLWESGWQALRPAAWPGLEVRQDEEAETLYDEGDVTITTADVAAAVEAGRKRLGEEFAGMLMAEEVEKE